MTSDNQLFEPVKLYKSELKQLHAENTKNYFEDLVKTTGVDEDANKETVKKINNTIAKIEREEKLLKKQKGIRGFLIFLTIVFGLVAAIFGFQLYEPVLGLELWVNILVFVLALIIFISLIVVIVKVSNTMIKRINERIADLVKIKNNLIDEAYAQLYPLNSYYDYGISNELFEKTVPLIKMDRYFNIKRWDYLVSKYNLGEYGRNESVLIVHTGEIVGNPFVINRVLSQDVGSKTYTGSLVITWVETYYSDGKAYTRTRSQTLTASVTKPIPIYSTDTYLIYGNEAAERLNFSRHAGNIHQKNEKEYRHFIKKMEKEIEKEAEKSTRKGGTFNPISNLEFEAVWGAFDRDDEQQYRLLFTALAQRQLTSLLRDDSVGYGDDFDFWKRRNLNFVRPNHLRGADIADNPERYIHYDLSVSRAIFNNYNNNYFKQIFFTMAPLISIPLYQQYEPQEYIYRDIYPSYAAMWEHEEIANRFDIDLLRHPESITENILKTRVVSSGDNIDEIEITAYGFRGEPRTDYVPVHGGDGYTHQVPVHWIEYIAVSNTTNAIVKVAEENTTYQDFRKGLDPNSSWADAFKKLVDDGHAQYSKSLIGMLVAGRLSNEERRVYSMLKKPSDDKI